MTEIQKQDRVDAILQVAENHIRRGGFNAVSFRDIANEVGIKSSSVHYHFPHKHDLGRSVVERYSERFCGILGFPSDPKETPAARITRLGNAYYQTLIQDDAICLGCVLGAETAGLPEEVQSAVSAFFEKIVAWTKDALENSDGPAADPHYIIGALQGAMVLSITLNDPDKLKDTAERLVRSV